MSLMLYTSGGHTPVALQTSARTMLSVLSSSTVPIVALKKISVSYNGAAAAAGLLAELCVTSTAGTATSLTARAVDQRNTVASAATVGYNCTAEPTVTYVLEAMYIPPTQGVWIPWPLQEEYSFLISTGFGIRLTGAASNVPFAAVQATWGE